MGSGRKNDSKKVLLGTWKKRKAAYKKMKEEHREKRRDKKERIDKLMVQNQGRETITNFFVGR